MTCGIMGWNQLVVVRSLFILTLSIGTTMFLASIMKNAWFISHPTNEVMEDYIEEHGNLWSHINGFDVDEGLHGNSPMFDPQGEVNKQVLSL